MKSIIISIIVAACILYAASYITVGKTPSSGIVGVIPSEEAQGNNVAIVDGKQIITISARGGYSPKVSIAKAGVKTVIRFKTNGTFDCSSSVRIPSLSISKSLPATGETDIDLGVQNVGTLNGTCSMGMYNFEVKFEG